MRERLPAVLACLVDALTPAVARILMTTGALLFALPTSAEPIYRTAGFELFAGYQGYSMSTVNAALADFGTVYPGATGSADRIRGGVAIGGALRASLTSRVLLSLEVSSMHASTHGTTTLNGLPYDVTIETPAVGLSSSVEYHLLAREQLRAGIGAGYGYYCMTGTLKLRHSFAEVRADMDAEALGPHVLIFGEVRPTGGLAARISAGYRRAKASSLRVDEREVRASDGSRVAPDWSGWTLRLSISYDYIRSR